MHVVNKLVKTIWYGCASVVFQYRSNILLSCYIVYGWYRLIRLLSSWKRLLSVNNILMIYLVTNNNHLTMQMNPIDEQLMYDCNLSNIYKILKNICQIWIKLCPWKMGFDHGIFITIKTVYECDSLFETQKNETKPHFQLLYTVRPLG